MSKSLCLGERWDQLLDRVGDVASREPGPHLQPDVAQGVGLPDEGKRSTVGGEGEGGEEEGGGEGEGCEEGRGEEEGADEGGEEEEGGRPHRGRRRLCVWGGGQKSALRGWCALRAGERYEARV